jgi:asparagine synthase (glutamine-hydrolysing)
MCGITGYLNLNGKELDPYERHLERMCGAITHRGPDEEGRKYIGPAALGMTRLSIIDLSGGQQPISNEDGTIWIVFNGEIYNFHELQKFLRAKGHQLRTKSDTEVIVHLYEEFGADCLQKLEGMYSFAIWDSNTQTLFIARDRMGEKPLHWGIFEGQFVFGSEIKAILTHPKSRKNLNLDALQKYLALEYVPSPESIFEGIHKLRPGHFLRIKEGQIEIHNYWKPDVSCVQPKSEEAAAEELIALLDQSIKLRMISDVPLGIFLSGGIDSSSIAALAAAQAPGKLRTFSIGFADRSFDESPYARTVANFLGSEHETVEFQPDLALDTLTELWDILDEPIADASIVPTYFLSKMTRRSVTVALSGEGGDELFGGYPTYQAHRLISFWKHVPTILRKGLIEPAVRALPVNMNNLSFDYKLKRFIAAADEEPRSRHLRWMGSIPLPDQARLVKKHGAAAKGGASISGKASLAAPGALLHTATAGDVTVSLPGRRAIVARGDKGEATPKQTKSPSSITSYYETLFDSESDYFQLGDTGGDVVDEIMKLDLRTYLPDNLLVKSDRASMAASLEVRLPFLAHPLVEFALSLPSSLKVRGMYTKYLLKKAVAPYLPASTVNRPKKGFGIPVAKWLNSNFCSWVDELLSESFISRQGLFEYSEINSLLQEHRRQQADRRKELWTLFMFQCWWQKYFA